jgi:hypothetical protein
MTMTDPPSGGNDESALSRAFSRLAVIVMVQIYPTSPQRLALVEKLLLNCPL